jgi:hypothetical protein
MPPAVADVIANVCRQFTQDGMSFELLSVDDASGTVEIGLGFTDVDCLDCVLPAEHLERLIATSLHTRTNRGYEVRLHDPRVAAAKETPDTGEPAFITVLDPTALGRTGDPNPGPDAGSLAGKQVLIRVDALWRAWDWTVEEWTALLGKAGASVLTWRRWQGLPGDEGRRKQAEYTALVKSSDVVISGLGNCGSCSAWTVRDALVGLNAGIPTAAVVTEQFEPLARVLSEESYRPGLRLHVLPYPLDTRPEPAVRDIARESFPGLLAVLGARV